MFWVFVSTILESVSGALYKKAVLISKISPVAFQFYSELLPFPILAVILYIVGFDFSLFLSSQVLLGFLLINGTYLAYNKIEQGLYKVEKMSTLIPYFKLNNFILIVVGFLVFRDASLISFLICLGSLILMVAMSFDYKNHEFPKSIGKIILHQVLRSAEVITIAYVLKTLTEVEYIILFQCSYAVIGVVVVGLLRQLGEIKNLTTQVAKIQVTAYYLNYGTFVINAFLLKEFGLVMTMLFWFFGSGLSVLLAYFMFREIPSKKDVTLWFLLIALVGVAYYFR